MKRRELPVSLRGQLNPTPVENADYHRHAAISASHLKEIERSPQHYWARFVDPNRIEPTPTPAMQLGTAVHAQILELNRFDEIVAVAPEGIDRRTKVGKESWAAFESEAKGKVVISRDDAAIVSAMGRAVFSHPAAAMLLAFKGKAETSWFWTDEKTGLECKCRPDWLLDDGSVIVDLKTTEDASLGGFSAASRSMPTISNARGISTGWNKRLGFAQLSSSLLQSKRNRHTQSAFTQPMPR